MRDIDTLRETYDALGPPIRREPAPCPIRSREELPKGIIRTPDGRLGTDIQHPPAGPIYPHAPKTP